MRKFVVSLLFLIVFLVQTPQEVSAATSCSLGPSLSSGFNVKLPDYVDGASHTVNFDMSNYDEKDYFLTANRAEGGSLLTVKSPVFNLGEKKTYSNSNGILKVDGSIVTWKITDQSANSTPTLADKRTIHVNIWNSPSPLPPSFLDYICTAGSYEINNSVHATDIDCELYVWQERNGEQCGAPGCLSGGGITTYIEAKNMRLDGELVDHKLVKFKIGAPGGDVAHDQTTTAYNGAGKIDFPAESAGTHTVSVDVFNIFLQAYTRTACPTASFEVSDLCGNICSPVVTNIYSAGAGDQPLFELCNQVTEDDQDKCLECIDKPGVWTAIGCIPTDPQNIIKTMVQLGLSIGGGVTLLLILAGAFRLSVSSGDPKQAEEAKEQITSAVIGLLFIIFSITMLRFIGVQFLQIPGFGG
ncbi:MAG: pilin [Candidatus Paceibacterota bacterium]